MEDPHYAQAAGLLDSTFDDFMRFLGRNDGWVDIGSEDGVTGTKINADDGPQQVRCIGNINKPFRQIFNFLWDFNNKRLWDETLKEIRMVKPLGDNMRIIYEQTNAPWPVSNRDFVYAQRFIERDDGIIVINKSINGVLPDTNGVVRGEIIFSGYYLKSISNDVTQVTTAGSIDVKGSIPNALKNKSAKKQVGKLLALRKALK